MAIVAVVGAGMLGGSLAHKLASRERFNQVRLIDAAGGIAAGKAADIQQAAAVERFHTRVTAHEDTDAVVDADVIVLTGPAETPDVEWPEDVGLHLLARVSAVNRGAVIVCAGASHRRLVGRGVATLGLPRHRLIGSAPSAFHAALQAIVAVELRCSASEVSLAVLGIPPQHIVVPWSEAAVRGVGISQLLDPPRLVRLRQKVPLVWPPAPYTLASATARVCEAIADGTGRRSMSCFVVLDGELKVRGRTAAMMVEVGGTGVTRILDPSLSIQERVQLETALAARGESPV